MKHILTLLLFFFSFTVGAAPYEGLTRELMAELEKHLDADYYKSITAADRELALELLQHFEGKGRISSNPKLILSAGAMTAGKTTTFDEFEKHGILKREEFTIIDPDEMKALIPGYQDAIQKGDKEAGTKHHLLSMYMGDILLGWCFLQKKSAAYMTSLRWTPSAQLLIERVRRDHPSFEISIVYVRAPVSSLMARNIEREKKIKRLVPPDLLRRSVPEVENTVRELEAQVDKFVLVVNDENRAPRVSYLRHNNLAASTNIQLSESERPEPIAALREFLAIDGKNVDQSLHLTPPMDFIADIDWSTFYPVATDGPGVIKYQPSEGGPTQFYRSADGLGEFITVLLGIPGMRVSFISGGTRERNEEVVRSVLLADGSTVFERVYKVLTTEDLQRVSADPALKFSAQLKKDPKKVVRDLRRSETIALDDQPNAYLEGVASLSVLWLQNTFQFIGDFENFSPAQFSKKTYLPKFRPEWQLERNKLAWALGIVLTAVEIKKQRGISLREAMTILSRDLKGRPISRESLAQYKFYLRGAAAMSQINPDWNRVSLPSRAQICQMNLQRLFAKLRF